MATHDPFTISTTKIHIYKNRFQQRWLLILLISIVYLLTVGSLLFIFNRNLRDALEMQVAEDFLHSTGYSARIIFSLIEKRNDNESQVVAISKSNFNPPLILFSPDLKIQYQWGRISKTKMRVIQSNLENFQKSPVSRGLKTYSSSGESLLIAYAKSDANHLLVSVTKPRPMIKTEHYRRTIVDTNIILAALGLLITVLTAFFAPINIDPIA